MSARFARRAATAGLLGGAAWIALGVESTIRGGSHTYRDAVWSVPWVLTMVCLVGVYVAQRAQLRRWGRVAFGVLGMAMLLVLAGNAGIVFHIAALRALGFPGGALLWLLVMVPAGVATYRAGVLPRRVGVLLALLEPLSIATGLALSPIAGLYDSGNYSGGIEKGLVVLLVARALGAVVVASRPHEDPTRPRDPVPA